MKAKIINKHLTSVYTTNLSGLIVD